MVYPGLKLEVHHIKPWSRGGLHALENLVLACFDCNHKVATQNIEPLFKPRSVRREEEHSKRIEEHTKNLADIHAAIKKLEPKVEEPPQIEPPYWEERNGVLGWLCRCDWRPERVTQCSSCLVERPLERPATQQDVGEVASEYDPFLLESMSR
jgi:hypothetical protein